jgi:hypothetical protein
MDVFVSTLRCHGLLDGRLAVRKTAGGWIELPVQAKESVVAGRTEIPPLEVGIHGNMTLGPGLGARTQLFSSPICCQEYSIRSTSETNAGFVAAF